ncbi:MAG: hypothetical protein COS68_02755 [Elusimicrobia bacterium CG06_land_8_20_14_3_00_38_11]|nr:MAG: hypothetical protein COS68_02755 [Elusimicrobia bacterium CG06_land_8_20_14_3_00_38_11]
MYPREGDWEKNEFHVYMYFSLNSPRSRCQLKKGKSINELEHIAKIKGYEMDASEVMEYMPSNNDLFLVLKALKKADELRDLRRKCKEEGIEYKEISKKLKKEVKHFQDEIDEIEEKAERERPQGISLCELMNEIGYIKKN